MKHLVFTAALGCLLASAAHGADRLAADHDSRAEQEIKALEFHLAGLLMRGELDVYRTFLAEDYTRITDKGRVQSREEVLRQFAAKSEPAAAWSMEPTDLDVKVYGDTAILTGLLKLKPRAGASPAAPRVNRFRKVFIRRDGHWYLVSLQGVPYVPDSGPKPR